MTQLTISTSPNEVRKPSKTKSPRSSPGWEPVLPVPPIAGRQYAIGKSLRDKCPRQSHSVWKAPGNRPDPVALVIKSDQGRIPQPVPLRHGRMLQSPFTFYRGAALNMAADLANTPATGLRVQTCGDCHLLNFGAFATPERQVIFDINDLDETLPAPWGWDVKRLAASLVLAWRSNGFSESCARDAAIACVGSYRRRMVEFSEMRVLDVWYTCIDMEDVIPSIQDKQKRSRIRKRLTEARNRSVVEHDFPKFAEVAGHLPKIKDNPPLIYHWGEQEHEKFLAGVKTAFASYRGTMQEDRRLLLDHSNCVTSRLKLWVSEAWAHGVASCSCWPAKRTGFSLRSRKPAPRCWRHTRERASIPTITPHT